MVIVAIPGISLTRIEGIGKPSSSPVDDKGINHVIEVLVSCLWRAPCNLSAY
jgi:hypothetical protein